MTIIPFIKMNGLGNDFVVIDKINAESSPRLGRLFYGANKLPFGLSVEAHSASKSKSALGSCFDSSTSCLRSARTEKFQSQLDISCKSQSKLAIAIADRSHGVGCDQVLLLVPSKIADIRMLIYNQDGSQSNMCGNGLRCVGKYLMNTNNTFSITIEINGRIYPIRKEGELVAVNIGRPITPPTVSEDFPGNPSIVNVGNPHIIFFITTAVSEVDLIRIGPKIEKDKRFPEGINVTFAQILDENSFKLRVWERGVGETAACGSAACATAAAAFMRGIVAGRMANIIFKAGKLAVNLLKDNSLEMIGDATIENEGEFIWNQ